MLGNCERLKIIIKFKTRYHNEKVNYFLYVISEGEVIQKQSFCVYNKIIFKPSLLELSVLEEYSAVEFAYHV